MALDKKVYTVYIPYPQTLVYSVEATSPEQAIEIAQEIGRIENCSMGGMADKPYAIESTDEKASK